MEAAVKISRRGQVIDKEGAVDFFILTGLLESIPVVSACCADSQGYDGKKTPGVRKKSEFQALPDSRNLQSTHWHSLPAQGNLPGLMKPASDFTVKRIHSLIENLPCFVAKFRIFVHNSMPFALSAAASVWVAREQCVFTLPSEQPIAAAVSAISISSQ